MAKKHNQNKQIFNTKAERIAVWASVTTLVVTQVVLAIVLLMLWNGTQLESRRDVYSLIARTEESRYKYPIIDVSENRVYIPEARLYLPLDEVSRNMRYDFRTFSDQKILHLSSSSIVGRQHDDDAPTCDKIITLTSIDQQGSIGGNYTEIAKLQPALQGFQYMYAHPSDSCHIYYDSLRADFIKTAKQVQQY